MVPYIDKAISYMNIPIDEVELSFLERAIKTVFSEQKMKHEILSEDSLLIRIIAEYFFLIGDFKKSDEWYEKFESLMKKKEDKLVEEQKVVTLINKELITIADLQNYFGISYNVASRKMREIKHYRDSLRLSGKVHRSDYIAYLTRNLTDDIIKEEVDYARGITVARKKAIPN